jgi:phage replication-related protein YjqB (UPF0714/DUF867 family)
MDLYRNFAELVASEGEGVDFAVRLWRREAARTVVLAPHGGGIEPGSSEVARQIAGGELSLAVFEGLKSRGNGRLHITSTNFDEPRCMELVRAAEYVVAIHGEKSDRDVTFVGGRDAALGERIRAALESGGFAVEVHVSAELQGTATANICNRGRRGQGVQLELGAGLRKRLFESLTAEGRARPTGDLERYAAAVRAGLRAGGALQAGESTPPA